MSKSKATNRKGGAVVRSSELVRRQAWIEAQRERSKTSKALQWKRQAYINAKSNYDRAREREEYLYREYMQEPPND